jgi:S-adenosylmethionine/arginine decarboxylase-like enzyme
MSLRLLEMKARLRQLKLIFWVEALIIKGRTMWGKHLIIDMSAGDRERVQSAQHISRFVETLVETIGMRAYGAPLLEHFAEHLPEAAGYSLVQLIETSAITGHFCDLSGDAYIDIFSCKDFDAELAVEVVRAAFRPQHINFITLVRQAVTPRASYMLAAEYVLAED